MTDDRFTEHQRKAGQSKSPKKLKALAEALEPELITKNNPQFQRGFNAGHECAMNDIKALQKDSDAQRAAMQGLVETLRELNPLDECWCPSYHDFNEDGHAPECDDARAALESARNGLADALIRIRDYPVYCEPVGGAYAMQDIARAATESWLAARAKAKKGK